MDWKTYDIDVQVKLLTGREVELRWSGPGQVEVHTFLVTVVNLRAGKEVIFFTGAAELNVFKVPVYLTPGDTYQVHVKGLTLVQPDITSPVMYHMSVCSDAKHFTAELQKHELKELMKRAERHKNPGKQSPTQHQLCQHLYRNKPRHYFTNIFKNRNNVMEVYTKDYNGDPGSPINGKINGLFFGTSIDVDTGQPPLKSHFGEQRININSEVLFHDNTNLYFADFYCNNLVHYVTLVLTSKNSPADALCKEKLVSLDVNNNPFMYRMPSVYTGMQRSSVYVRQSVWVEVLYTENINLLDIFNKKLGFFTISESYGKSRVGGIPKNPECSICNLYR